MRFRYSTDDKGKLVKKALVYTAKEHGIEYNDVDSQAVFIVERLRANGYETYIVGGAVRDLILKKKPKDFDIVSAANPTRIKKVFRNARIIGNRFRLVHVFFNNKIFEVSTFRSNEAGPTGNIFGDIGDDVLRRDFSLNALFYDPLKQVVVDYVGGMKDIKTKKIRPIIPLDRIFTDDPVRMIRAVKYGVITGFKLRLSLRMKIRRQSSLLSAISPSRLTEEVFKIINSSNPGRIADNLDKMGLYQYLQPQAVSLFKTKPGYRDRYLRTLTCLDQEPGRNNQSLDSDLPGPQQNAPGEKMAGLIRDYLEDIIDWKGVNEYPPKSLQERYRDAFLAARKFVLPMNPPRLELDYALKILFAEHGVIVKRGRFRDKPHDKSHDKPRDKPQNDKQHHDRPQNDGKPSRESMAKSPAKAKSPLPDTTRLEASRPEPAKGKSPPPDSVRPDSARPDPVKPEPALNNHPRRRRRRPKNLLPDID